ncbi:MAG: hypothetical protein ACON5B_04735 [Myxococcota bacterium]
MRALGILTPATLVLFASACGPQNAQITAGDYTAYMAASQSLTVRKGDINFDAIENRRAIDCREFADANAAETEALRIAGRDLVCPGDDGVGNSDWPPAQEAWLGQDGFYVFGEQLDPWRGEAIITSEGDVQIGFHHSIPGGADMRFSITVDPGFQPTICEQNEAGDGVVANNLDGDWVENWTQEWYDSNDPDGDPTGAQVFNLNAFSYQFDTTSIDAESGAIPTFLLDRWSLPEEWRAGFARARLGDDDFDMRRIRYGEPEAYIAEAIEDGGRNIFTTDPWVCALNENGDPEDNRCYGDYGPFVFGQYGELVSYANDVADEVDTQLHNFGIWPKNEDGTEINGLPALRPTVEKNRWRQRDDVISGLDNWVGLNYAWVKFDAGSQLEVGGAASGEFMVFFDGTENASRLIVRGRFDVSKFKQDTWGTPYLPTIKFEESGTTPCGLSPEDA